PAGALAATATGAAADTPSSVSSSFTSAAASIKLMFFKKSFTCSRVTSMSCLSLRASDALRGVPSTGLALVVSGFGRLTAPGAAFRQRVDQTREHRGRLVQGSQQLGRGGLQHPEELGEDDLARRQCGERLHVGRRQDLAVEEGAAD